MKFSGLNVDFSSVRSVSFDPLGSKSPLYEGIKSGHPLQTRDFCYWRL